MAVASSFLASLAAGPVSLCYRPLKIHKNRYLLYSVGMCYVSEPPQLLCGSSFSLVNLNLSCNFDAL